MHNKSAFIGHDNKNVSEKVTFIGHNNMIPFNEDNVTEQMCIEIAQKAGGKRLDIVLLINGLPMVIGEVKTATNFNVSWADGAKDICDYQKSLPEMFVPNILSFATEGRELYYAAVGTPLGKWGPWFATEERPHGALKDVRENLASLIDPLRLLEIYRFFSVYTTEKSSSKKIKIVCRYQQYYGGKAIVDRVMSRVETGIGPKKGLIWHFQGSGKSWLMVFASQMLMKKVPKAPTVVIVDDRRDQNTFRCFGAEEDEDRGSYMSKYSYQDSIDDGATLELNFKEVPVEMHLDEEKLQEAFDEMVRDNNLIAVERDELTRRTNVEAFFTDPKVYDACLHSK